MPITGELDVTQFLANLGDPDHGLVAAPPVDPNNEDVFRASWGTIDMSTGKGLAVIPKFVWDVNGYYRALGFSWPFKPTKRELREAYQARDGQSDDYLTYVLKQLVVKTTRAKYDGMELGTRYRDIYVIREEYEKLKDVAQEMSEEQGRLVTVEDVKREYGDPDKEKAKELHTARPVDTWDWGHYALSSRCPEVEPLREWQKLLTDVFHSKGLVETISIGYIGKSSEDVAVKTFDGRVVIFLNDEVTPTPELAESALSKYTAHRQKGTK